MIIGHRDTTKPPMESDEEICGGCYCFSVAKKGVRPLKDVCHGEPSVENDDTTIICPCSDCLIKTMCKSICRNYKSYMALTINYKKERTSR